MVNVGSKHTCSNTNNLEPRMAVPELQYPQHVIHCLPTALRRVGRTVCGIHTMAQLHGYMYYSDVYLHPHSIAYAGPSLPMGYASPPLPFSHNLCCFQGRNKCWRIIRYSKKPHLSPPTTHPHPTGEEGCKRSYSTLRTYIHIQLRITNGRRSNVLAKLQGREYARKNSRPRENFSLFSHGRKKK